MKRPLLALLMTFSLAQVAQAADTYETDSNHTFARFSYSHLGYSTQLSRFDKVSGTITLDTAAKTGSADITVDPRSVTTGSEHLNEHLQEEAFFDSDKYPVIHFVGKSMKFDGNTPTEVDGELTIKGITRPVALQITSFKCMPHPMLKKFACGADAVTHLKRTDFNMAKYVPYVGDDVTVTLSVEAVKQ